jgi:cyclophilin family peptidyl-prolyl cis-trans isomerase
MGQIRGPQRRPIAPPTADMSPEAARQAILAAEDRRLPIPDDLHTPAMDTLRELQREDVRLLVRLARDGPNRPMAIRALGRYERRELTPELMQIMASQEISSETINAVAQSFRGPPLELDMSAEQFERLLRPESYGAVDVGRVLWYTNLPAVTRSLARLPYAMVPQVQSADTFLVRSIDSVLADHPQFEASLPGIAQAAESRARLHAKFGPLNPELVRQLRRIVLETPRPYPGKVEAMQALVAARALDEETLRKAANDEKSSEMRRLAAASIGGTGSPLAPSERGDLLLRLMKDPNTQVRIEAVRGYARRETEAYGCDRLIDRVREDRSVPVVLVTLDLFGDLCRTDINVTNQLTVEARNPPPLEWHQSAHALLSLAKRAPDRATIAMPNHLASPTWQVRMYAARTAAILNDSSMLERLAYDPVDNVREAALPALRRLKKADADAYFVAALARSDYQLLRTASRELKGATSTPELAGALADALRRVSADKKDTSRDVRLELLDRLRELGSADHAGAVEPLLRDFDIEVALSAGKTLQLWTGQQQEVAPAPLPRPSLPGSGEGGQLLRMELRSGKVFRIRLRPDVAPLNAARFSRLALSGYYTGLTIHRVVPNFIIQGGSPGDNEYVGDGPYVRDEIGLLHHGVGSIGMSTRGRDTGDGQFFINLVDNPRLDFDYTVFGQVVSNLDALSEVLEGDVISSITVVKDDDEKAPVQPIH